MDIIILGGFLGSGKTTMIAALARAYAQRSGKETPVAILENEVGSSGVDDKILKGRGFEVTTLLNGCACCALIGDVPEAVLGIREQLDPDLLIIEASGLAVPSRIRDALEKTVDATVSVWTLVDASRWERIRVPLAVILRQQLEGCDAVLVTKVDLVDEGTLARLGETLDEFNDSAPRYFIDATSESASAVLGEALAREGAGR